MRHPVAVIVLAQLFGTSLWFSTNSAAADLVRQWGIAPAAIGTLTNAVQLGFILGTLSFSLTGLADRYAASRIFAICAAAGAAFNAGFALFAGGKGAAVPLRFAVGFCLAVVYPLGMKLVVSWVPAQAWLVGMLTLGTALPHGIRLAGGGAARQATILVSSALALFAAALIAGLGDGPYLKRRADAPPLRLGQVVYSFAIRDLRASRLRLFRPPVGSLCLLDRGAVPRRPGRPRRTGQPGRLGAGFCRHRRRRPRLRRRTPAQPIGGKRPRRGDRAGAVGALLRPLPDVGRAAGLGEDRPPARLGRQRRRGFAPLLGPLRPRQRREPWAA